MRRLIISLSIMMALVAVTISVYKISDTLAYPKTHLEIVNAQTDKYSSVDSALVMSLIKAESSFRLSAESRVGARGLMQIMPSTGDWLADQLSIPDYTADSLFDPQINIVLGVYYLDYLVTKFQDVNTALAAYNAGEGNVGTWLNDPKYSKDGKTLSQIKFTETTNYVQKINKFYKKYLRILKNA